MAYSGPLSCRQFCIARMNVRMMSSGEKECCDASSYVYATCFRRRTQSEHEHEKEWHEELDIRGLVATCDARDSACVN